MCATMARETPDPVARDVTDHCCIVADTGLSAALPLSLSARAKRNSDRRHHEARNDRSFVVAEATCVGCLGLAGACL